MTKSILRRRADASDVAIEAVIALGLFVRLVRKLSMERVLDMGPFEEVIVFHENILYKTVKQ